MVLLQAIVEVFICPMDDFPAEYAAYGMRVGVMSVGSHSQWLVANYIFGLFEEPLGCVHVSVLTQHRLHQVAISINGTIDNRGSATCRQL